MRRLANSGVRGGRVVAVCNTPDRLKDAEKPKCAAVVKSYAEVADTLQAR